MSRRRPTAPEQPVAPAADEPFAFPTARTTSQPSEAAAATAPAAGTDGGRRRGRGDAAGGGNMLPTRGRRRLGVERLLVRLIATLGVIGIGVVLGAILTSNHVRGWIIGLVVAGVTVVLSAVLWSSRQV